MKKLFGALAGFVATALIAGPVNGPASSTQFETGMYSGAQQDYSYRVSYVGDAVLDRKLEVRHVIPAKREPKAERQVGTARVNEAKLTENGVGITFGVYDRLDVFARASQASLSTAHYQFNEPHDLIKREDYVRGDLKIETDADLKWAAGARAVLWSQDNTTLNAFGEYSRFKTKVNNIHAAGFDGGLVNIGNEGQTQKADNTLSEKAHVKARVRDWHVGLGLAHSIQVSPDLAIVPSVAVKYSDAHVRFKNPVVSTTSASAVGAGGAFGKDTAIKLLPMRARSNVGVAVGVGLYAGKTFAVNVEGRFIDESAIGVNAEFRL